VLRLANKVGVKEAGDGGSRIRIDMPLSRQSLGELAGTTLHTVSRILSGWESRGLIEGGRQRIVLREPHKLFVLAEATSGEDGSLERP